jgi:hypothetical protein
LTKIAIIGAGSIVFCKALILDILASGLEDVEFSLMAPTDRKITYVKQFAERVIKENGLSAKASVTTDRREAVRDAAYIIPTFQIGGVSAIELDYQIPWPGRDFSRPAKYPGNHRTRLGYRRPISRGIRLELRKSHVHNMLGTGDNERKVCGSLSRGAGISGSRLWLLPSSKK